MAIYCIFTKGMAMEVLRKVSILMANMGYKPKNIMELTGFSSSKVSKLLNGGQKIIGDDLDAIAIALRVDPRYLKDEEEFTPMRYVPIIGSASCGVPDGSISDMSEPYLVDGSLFSQTSYIVVADGDSMSTNTKYSIESGDLLLCDSKPVQDNDIVHYIVESTGESGIKRYSKSQSHIILTADNNEYKPIIINKDDTITANRVMAIIKPTRAV